MVGAPCSVRLNVAVKEPSPAEANVAARILSPVPRLASALTARFSFAGLRSVPELQPLSLGGTVLGGYVTVLCVAGVVAVTAFEAFRPGLASLGSLLFIPVIGSAWLLGQYEAAIVSALAIGARVAGYSIAGVDLGTALAEVGSLAALALTTRLAARSVVASRETAARVARNRRELELITQREEIALTLTDTAIRRLYALSIRLQAVSTAVDQPNLKVALSDAIAEADRLSANFRRLVFKQGERESN